MKPESDTPRTDAARLEYKRWEDYVEHYGHIPEAMEQAPTEADPFDIAETLERELAAARAELERAMRVVDAAVSWSESASPVGHYEFNLYDATKEWEAGR